ncbi:hypothetical protein ACFOWE_32840 [Planomonospora corallina]|uniref:Flagellin N-terminal domain-containing protein n=1 Tax=Planomonospora corallina TaxID=1806052 RepID=A0ABV8IHQ2_9ACTN
MGLRIDQSRPADNYRYVPPADRAAGTLRVFALRAAEPAANGPQGKESAGGAPDRDRLRAAVRDARRDLSAIRSAEDALEETRSILQGMRDLAVQADRSGTGDPEALTRLQTRIATLGSQLGLVSGTAALGSAGAPDGPSGDGGNRSGRAAVPAARPVDAAGFGPTELITAVIDLTTDGGASAALTALNTAIQKVSTARSSLHALRVRFEDVAGAPGAADGNRALPGTAAEGRAAPGSTIHGSGAALEVMGSVRSRILSESAAATDSHGERSPGSVLRLLS